MKHTPKDEVLGRIEAQGPCTLDQLCWSVKEQCILATETDYAIRGHVVTAINDLCKEGLIELYDTGDAWDAV